MLQATWQCLWACMLEHSSFKCLNFSMLWSIWQKVTHEMRRRCAHSQRSPHVTEIKDHARCDLVGYICFPSKFKRACTALFLSVLICLFLLASSGSVMYLFRMYLFPMLIKSDCTQCTSLSSQSVCVCDSKMESVRHINRCWVHATKGQSVKEDYNQRQNWPIHQLIILAYMEASKDHKTYTMPRPVHFGTVTKTWRDSKLW